MANKILLRRGLKSKLPTLSAGEPAYTTDSREFFMGTGSGNVNMGGSQWYTGAAMSGTSTSTTYYYSSCPLVKIGDIYLNTTYGYIYQCTTAGSGTTARWQYKGCIRGPQGATGAKGDTGESIDYFPSGDYVSMDELTLDVADMKGEHLAPPTTITIGCIDSLHNWLANYVCMDNQDHSTIFKKAFDALPSSSKGGKITVLEGEYTFESSIDNRNRNVIIEGMGISTKININAGFYTSSNTNVTFKNCHLIFNTDGTPAIRMFNNDDKIEFDHCLVEVISKGGEFIVGGSNKNIDHLNATATMSFCELRYTLTSFTQCSNIFTALRNVKLSNSTITIRNEASTTTSTGYMCNVNLIYDDYIDSSHDSDNDKTIGLIDNCTIKCVGKKSANGRKSTACISHSPGTLISNSRIELGDYAAISQGVDVVDGRYFDAMSNCQIVSTSTLVNDIYIGGHRVSNSLIVVGKSRSIVYFAPGMIVSASSIEVLAPAKVYNNGIIIFVNNQYNQGTSSLTTHSSAIIANNYYSD